MQNIDDPELKKVVLSVMALILTTTIILEKFKKLPDQEKLDLIDQLTKGTGVVSYDK